MNNMNSKYDFIKDLNPSKEDWKIKAKVICTWRVPNFERKDFDDNVEMVLLDEEGGRIHATVRGSLQVRKKITEGDVIFLKNFGVGLNSGNFKATRHTYRLSFNLRTDVRTVFDAKIPVNEFDFIDFDDIEKEGHDSPYLVDVIGLISGIGEVREHVVSGRKTKMIVIELDDLRGHKLECTLWEQYVDQVQSFLAKNESPHNVVVIQLAKIKGFKGKNGITNTKYTTRVIFDCSLPAIVEFKLRLSSESFDSSVRLTQLSTQTSYSFENDFLKETERKCINDIKNSCEVSTCVTYGTIKTIESKYNWWYKSCKKCPYSVCEDFEKWYCKNCQKHWDDYYPRFSIQVRVVDDTDSASFVLFDRDCIALLRITASDLREQHFKRGADLEYYPDELNTLIEKSLLFKINVKKNQLNSFSEPKYQVSKVCSSESVIDSFLKSAVVPNDDSTFESPCDIYNTTAGPDIPADVESQTCESTAEQDVSLTLLTPTVGLLEAVDDKDKPTVGVNKVNETSCSAVLSHV